MKNRNTAFIVFIGLAVILSACSLQQTTSAPNEIQATATITVPTQAIPTSASEMEPSPTGIPAATVESVEDGELAYEYLVTLSKIGSRTMDTPTHQQAEEYISTTLKEMGYSPVKQTFQNENGVDAANIIAEKPGLSNRVMIVGGHYDSVSAGSGVDDNGSGVAVMLEAAKRISEIQTPFTIRFIFFDSEETGLEGSKFYTARMTQEEIDNTVAMINLDSLAVGDYTYIYGSEGGTGAIRDWALEYAAQNGLALVTQTGKNPDYPIGTTVDASDHAPFLYLGIQYAYFEATNWDLGDLDGYVQVDPSLGDGGEIWHTKYDNLEYIQQTFPGRMEEHLSLFSNVLMHILMEYGE